MTTTSAPIVMDPERVFPRLSSFSAVSGYNIPRTPREDEQWFEEHRRTNANKIPGQSICEYLLEPELNEDAIEMSQVSFRDPLLEAMFTNHSWLLGLLHVACLQDPPGNRFLTMTDTWRYDSLIESFERDPQRFAYFESVRLQDAPPFRFRDEFHWLRAFDQSVREGTQLLVATYRFGQGHFSDADETTELVRKAYLLIPPMTRLLVLLLNNEDVFESTYATKHFCDTLMNKRLRCVNPRLSSYHGYHWAYRQTIEQTERLQEGLAEYTMAMRNLYAYRYIVEWCPGRPWKQIYAVVDESLGADAITEFMQFTSTTALAGHMFSVHPLFQGDIDSEDICAICQETYEAGDILMELRNCPHRFHANCITSHFDQHHRYDNRCPVCRTSAGRIQDFWPHLRTPDADVCYGRDPGASHEAELRDHQIRHFQRRGMDFVHWPDKIQEYFWERERLAWLDGATVEERMASFPRVVDDDQRSMSDDCEWDPLGAGDEDEEGEDVEGEETEIEETEGEETEGEETEWEETEGEDTEMEDAGI
ncbi:hypothetical protein PV11_07924 [Exophiala sideris]|uniref:RING-type domain-containing protein n=2 Tax=Exophiala sideris TaxID=1016849 RepID=A0A0D1YHH6_9EURO|nr:hypothetical protein PV11_07924 [Exophiala sideris]